MPTRREIIFAAAGVAIARPALAAEPSARELVTAIYDTYKGKDARGDPLDDDAAILRYFEPKLAAAMIRDRRAAARRKEVGTLDFDPFVDAHDWEIAAFDIAVSDAGLGKASATVKFTNAGQQQHGRARPGQNQGCVEDRQHYLDAAREAEYASRTVRTLIRRTAVAKRDRGHNIRTSMEEPNAQTKTDEENFAVRRAGRAVRPDNDGERARPRRRQTGRGGARRDAERDGWNLAMQAQSGSVHVARGFALNHAVR